MEQFLWDSPLAIIITNHSGSILECNAKAHSYFGRRHLENIQDLFSTDSQFDFDEILKFPEKTTYEGYFNTQQNQAFLAHLSASINKDQICWYIQNKQKQIELENAVEQYQNIPTEFGHELNNLLTIIISATELINMDSYDERHSRDIENILTASFRATSRIRSFMNFGRKQFSKKKILPLQEFLFHNVHFLQNCLGSQHKLSLPQAEIDANIYVPEASFRALLTHVCTFLRLHSFQASSYQLYISENIVSPPLSSHHLGIAEGKYYFVSFVEQNFPLTEQVLLEPEYIITSKDEILGQIWEASLRCGGSFLQRIAPNRRRCVTIYLPNIAYM